MKKFVIIASYLPSVLNFRYELLQLIQAKGFEIHIISPGVDLFTEYRDAILDSGFYLHNITMQRTGTNIFSDLKTLKDIYLLLRQIKPEFVLAYTIKPVVYGGIASRLLGVSKFFPLITGLGYIFLSAGDSSERSLFHNLIYTLYKISLDAAEKVFFQNSDDLALFHTLNIIPEQKPVAIVNGSGVNIDVYDVVPFPKDKMGNNKFSFLFIGRLLGDKGVREYVQAAKYLKDIYENIEFHLVGWIDKNPTAISQEELKEWVKAGTVTYWGKLDDVKPAIANCSVYVLPSYREGIPRTVLEAMAMGRAIITTKAPGCKETVIEGGNGFLVNIKSVDELAQAMEKFIIQPSLIEKMGRESRRIAVDKYDVNQVNSYMLKEMRIIND